jgi:hypothetical protein
LQSVRPLNLGETLDASIKIVRARWRTLAVIMLVIALPIELLTVLITNLTTDTYQAGTGGWTGPSADSKTSYSDEGAFIAGQVAVSVLGFLGYLLGTVACYGAIANQYLGRATSPSQSLRYAGDRFGTTLWLTIVLGIGLVFAFLALVIPGIWLAVAWSVAYPAMLVERLGAVEALKRSFKLVDGFWWSTAGRLIVAYILTSIFAVVVAFAFLIPAEWLVDDTSLGAQLLEAAANLATSLLTTPFIAAVVTLTYFDLRVRKEGFDLAVLAERMGGAAATDADPGASSGFGAPAPAQRDAFGNPVTSTPPPPARSQPLGWATPPSEAAPSGWTPPSPGTAPPAAAPGGDTGAGAGAAPPGWAPPVAPEPRLPPSADE